jgi:photosystem II stability/assembly factor-like uncharacterized protein
VARVTRRGITWATRAVEAAAILLASAIASANGRFPRAARLIESPRDPNRLAIVATYGLLLTDDGGGHWYHVCDAAFTFEQGFSTDPIFGLTADESFLVGAQTRLTRSGDRGCSWVKVLEPVNASIDDFAMMPGDADDIVAVVTDYGAASPQPRLFESHDGGLAWTPIGSPLPVVVAYTIDVDPKNRSHLYATGSADVAGPAAPAIFLSSSDRGVTWTSHAIPNTGASAAPYIAAVHPTDANKVFVRTDAWKMTSSGEAADDALLYTADGGVTWTDILHAGALDAETAGAKLLGLALSPDGSTVLAGYGDPIDPLRSIDPDRKWRGTYRSSSDGRYSFGSGAPSAPTPLAAGNVSCLTWTPRGIYTCILHEDGPSVVTFNTDQATAPMKLMDTSFVSGQPPCCGGGLAATCTWGNDCRALGACDAGGAGAPVTCVDAGAADGGRSSDAAVEVGPAGGVGGATGASPASSGCGCRASGRTSGGPFLFTALVAAFLLRLVCGPRLERRRAGLNAGVK